MVNWVLILSLFKGTLVYTKQIQTLKADFWKEGVGGSKKLLKKILKKITNYEEQHVNLDEQVNKEPDNVKKWFAASNLIILTTFWGHSLFLNDSQFLTKFWDQDIDQICEQVNKKLGKRFKRLGKGETGWAEFIFLNECETACITFACVHLSWNSESLDVDCFDSKDLEFRGLSCWIAQFSRGGFAEILHIMFICISYI